MIKFLVVIQIYSVFVLCPCLMKSNTEKDTSTWRYRNVCYTNSLRDAGFTTKPPRGNFCHKKSESYSIDKVGTVKISGKLDKRYPRWYINRYNFNKSYSVPPPPPPSRTKLKYFVYFLRNHTLINFIPSTRNMSQSCSRLFLLESVTCICY